MAGVRHRFDDIRHARNAGAFPAISQRGLFVIRHDNLLSDISAHQERRGGAHRAGTLTAGPLSTMQWYLEDYFKGRGVLTIETGCGASTVLFAHYADRHTVFCYDDRKDENSSVTFVTEFASFPHDRVEWIFGPTQRTIPTYSFKDHVDLVLIDGPHGFPFAELEYYYLYPLLKPGGVLIIDDIHIPTLNNLFRFLCQDDMFYLGTVTATTAFFHRSHAPVLNPLGDDWWLQRYNMQRFPAYSNAWKPGLTIPFDLTFDERMLDLDRFFLRGFILVDGKPVTESPLSIVRIPVEPAQSGKVVIEVDVEFVAPDQRTAAGFEIFINLESGGTTIFTEGAPARRTITLQVTLANSNEIEIKFHSFGLRHAQDIPGFSSTSFDIREPGVLLHGVAVRRADEDVVNHISMRQGAIVSFTSGMNRFHFFVDHQEDSIQGYHMAGRFYEEEELKLIARHVKSGSRILDIGANIGNHTIYFEKVIGAAQVIPIEPLPRAIELLKLNAALNGLTKTDMSLLGVALSDKQTSGSASTVDSRNLGGTIVTPNGRGSIPVENGDQLLAGRSFDFIKIDVEGHELNVINGLKKLIIANKPLIFIEVINENIEKLKDIMNQLGYVCQEEYRRYQLMTNLLFLHK
jgi:FkbM family methyltransferase